MPTRRHGPAYGLIAPDDLTETSRRRFLVAGALMSAVFNFGVASSIVWRQPKRRRPRRPAASVLPI